MLQFYPQINWMHFACVLASASLFAFRDVTIHCAHTGVVQRPSVRWCRYAMDCSLLIAGLRLVSDLRGARFASAWLDSKLKLSGDFLVLGAHALTRAANTRARRGFFPSPLSTCSELRVCITH